MPNEPDDWSPIPRIFHFVFGLRKQRERFHLAFYLCLKSCLEVNKPEKIYFYYDHLPYGSYWDLIRPHLTLVKIVSIRNLALRYKGFKENRPYMYAHQADFIRVEKVLEHGGVYADIDTIFVNPLPEHLYKERFVIGREDHVYCPIRKQYRPSLCNAIFMGQKNSPFLKEWLELMPSYFDGTWSNHSCYLPYEISEGHPDWVHIEEQDTFYKYMWTRDGLQRLFETVTPNDGNVCSIHLWSHLWWDKRRKDFSEFHQGLITENRIREIDTTFNLIARRFLPDRHEFHFGRAIYYWLKDATGFAANLFDRLLNLFGRLLSFTGKAFAR